ncbi:MAG: DUF4127 family protein [Candidatus Obscuribacterales bacterium]
MKILLIPLDDRPVTYSYPQLLAKLGGAEAVVPPRTMMGSLSRGAQIDELFTFGEGCLSRNEVDAAVICLDSLLYGGLITSRRSTEQVKTIQARLDRLKKWKELSNKPVTIYAQSSIMRISDNYDNTEEKEYWSRFGRELFEWSACLHRLASGEKLAPGLLESLERRIPGDIRQDYLDTRFRNFTINMTVLKSMEDGLIDHLVFSQDDSGAWGLNVGERDRLISVSQQMSLQNKVNIYAGADEVMCTLLGRLLMAENKPSLRLHFSPESCRTVASRYEGQEIGTTIQAQIKAIGLTVTDETAGETNASSTTSSDTTSSAQTSSLTMIVHGPSERQGDHITLPGLPDFSHIDSSKAAANTIRLIESAPGFVILCDVVYANGGDPLLMEQLIKMPELLKKICSYAGWNTTGNTTGSALGTAICTIAGMAINNKSVNDSQKRSLFTRLVDDWAYQTKVRKELQNEPSTQKLAELISPYIKTVSAALAFEPSVRLSFPWRRTFEIEIGFEGG